MGEAQWLKDYNNSQDKADKDYKHIIEKRDRGETLIHKIFKQTDEGKELLGIFKDSLIYDRIVKLGETQQEKDIGFMAGWQEFKRYIIQVCELKDKE